MPTESEFCSEKVKILLFPPPAYLNIALSSAREADSSGFISAISKPSNQKHLISRICSHTTRPSKARLTMSAAPRASLPTENLLSFFRLIGKLKTVKRTGWVYRNVSEPESVSDHMYRMSLMAMAIGGSDPPRRDRLMKMALVHDLAEAQVGDIAPGDGVSKADKYALEEREMRRVRDEILAGSKLGHELYDLWFEYDQGSTDDARLVKEIDKMEMIIQADEYEAAQGKDLEEFFESTKGMFHSPVMCDVDEMLRSQRSLRKTESSVRKDA